MDQLIKLRAWLWLNKEKILLGALVLVLCFQVYKVVYPPEVELPDPPKPPKNTMPEDSRILPGMPPIIPPLPDRVPATGLIENNPFTVYGIDRGTERDRKPQLWFVGLRPWGDGWRAEITTNPNARPKRYQEGEEFESFRLEKIDVENKEIVVYSQADGRSFTYPLLEG